MTIELGSQHMHAVGAKIDRIIAKNGLTDVQAWVTRGTLPDQTPTGYRIVLVGMWGTKRTMFTTFQEI